MRRIWIIGLAIILAILILGGIVFLLKPKPHAEAQKLYKKSLKLIETGHLEEAEANLTKIVSEFSESEVTDEAILNLAKIELKNGELLEAKNLVKMGITLYPAADSVAELQELLWDINIKILFSPIMTEESLTYIVKKGDTLYGIAKQFNTTVELIQESNGLEKPIIRPGKKLKIAGATFGIVVDKSKNTLTLKKGEEVIKVYKVSTGANNCTPVGNFKITNKLIDPVWYKAGAIVAAESPKNILGSRWMGLSPKGYGIHGTTEPESIGRQITQGCVRLLNKDVEELYSILPVGTEVTIVD